MPRVGPYGIPFPYEPYALQAHAMTALRAFLDQASANTIRGNEEREQVRVAVLESPTGTGKSQMLLNAVLSHLYDIASLCETREHEESSEQTADSATVGKKRTRSEGGGASCKELTLQEALARQRVEEERRTRRAERRRQARRRAKAQQLAAAQRRARAQAAAAAAANSLDEVAREEEEDNLIVQAAAAAEEDMTALDRSVAEAMLSDSEEDDMASDSTASSSSSSSSSDDDDSSSMGEMTLAATVPLRQPKVYFASRTHTQLQQLFEDFAKTEFATQPVLDRPSCETAMKDEEAGVKSPHRLRAVHLASRQHLCINAALRRRARGANGAEALNELCVEAMRYEYSTEGKAARRAALKDERAGVTRLAARLSAAAVIPPRASLNEDESQYCDDVSDMEEYGKEAADAKASRRDKGCAFCATHRLRAFLAQLKRLAREADQPKEKGASASMPSLTLTQMRALGRQLQACPYLVSRLLVRGADVVFVPYNYLMDETQRNGLLGGAATNAITPQELAAMDGECTGATSGKGGSTLANSLASVLYRRQHRYQRVGSAAGAHKAAQEKQQQQQPHDHEVSRTESGMQALDALCTAQALCQPPRFLGDLLVLDEAHNVVDHCRSLSTACVTHEELRLVRALVLYYLQRYDARLLTANKEHLRRLAWFCERLLAPLQHTGTQSASDEAAGAGRCVPFTSWLFDRGIDHVDVYPLLLFLTDSHLCVKLHGLVASVLSHPPRARTSNTMSGSTANAWHEVAAQLANYSTNGSTSVQDAQELRCGSGSGNNKENACASTATVSHTIAISRRHSTPLVKAATAAVGCDGPTEADVALALRLVSNALRHMTHFLRWYYYSDATTRVLLEPTTAAPSLMPGKTQLKLVQLEPGRHTLYPLFREVCATVLAGGTMQPLSLTCAPLLPAPPCRGGECKGVDEAVCLIREGHVVPASSVTVWALGAGPSRRRMEFSYQTLPPAAHHTGEAEASAPLWTELACTLLNLARVLPAAGAICFFTSHEVQHRFVRLLRSTSYYDEISAVKRIFVADCDDDDGDNAVQDKKARAGKSPASAEAVQRMLEAYKAYVLPTTGHRTRGAWLFTVMGGRLAEGINFVDDLARAVLVVGLPFAHASDTELKLHLRHIARTRLGQPSTNTSGSRLDDMAALHAGHMSAAEWGLYTDLCMRVVNQCIGRCIRHAKDYAAIILLDARYAERADIRRRVSAWLQPSLRVAGNFGDCFRGVRDFFATHTHTRV